MTAHPGSRGGPVTLGHVSRPNGLSGAVVVHVDPSMLGVLRRGLDLELRPKSGDVLRTRVHSAAPVRGGVRLTLDAVGDRNTAETLVGAVVVVDRQDLGLAAEGEFLESDLVGLEVVAQDGAHLGRLVEVIATGANDVYVVGAGDGREILVPAVAHAVLSVDLAAGRITVDAAALEYAEAPK